MLRQTPERLVPPSGSGGARDYSTRDQIVSNRHAPAKHFSASSAFRTPDNVLAAMLLGSPYPQQGSKKLHTCHATTAVVDPTPPIVTAQTQLKYQTAKSYLLWTPCYTGFRRKRSICSLRCLPLTTIRSRSCSKTGHLLSLRRLSSALDSGSRPDSGSSGRS